MRASRNPLGNAIAGVGDKIENIVNKQIKDKFAKFKSGGKKAPVFYIFKLNVETRLNGSTVWSFEPFDTALYPWIEPEIRNTVTQRIDYTGCVSQCLLKPSASRNIEER